MNNIEHNAKQLLKRISEKIGELTDKEISRVSYAPNYNEWRAYISQHDPYWEDITWRVKEPNAKGEAEVHLGFYSAQPSEALSGAIEKAEALAKGKVDHVVKNKNGIRLVWQENLNDIVALDKLYLNLEGLLNDFLAIAFDVLKFYNQAIQIDNNGEDIQSKSMKIEEALPKDDATTIERFKKPLKTFKVSIQGFGAEVTIGTLDNNEIQKISTSDKSLDVCVLEDFDDWRDKDDLYHCFGACSDYVIEITDENDELVCQLYSENLSEFDDEEFELKKCISLNIDIKEPLLICISFHKGTVFQSKFEAEEFDIKKLRLEIDDEVGIGTYYWGEMLRSIYYNEEEIYETDRYTDEISFEAYSNLN
jgi:hypothetical protein